MGLDYELLEQQYQKAVADKAEIEARTDLNDDERINVLNVLDKNIANIEEGIVGLGQNAKDEIMAAIANLNNMVATNERQIARHEEEIAKRQAEIEQELAKENPDQDLINSKQVEIDGLQKDIKKLKTAIRKIQKEIKEQNKKLIPLMKRFKDKVFSESEIADLEALDKKMERAQKAAETRKRKKEEAQLAKEEEKTEEPAEEEKVEEEPVAEEVILEEPVEEEPIAEEVILEEPVEEEPVAEEVILEEPVEEEPITEEVILEEPIEEPIVEEVILEEPVEEDPELITFTVGVGNKDNRSKKTLKQEFDELYKKAKRGTLEQEDYTRLAEITADTENYDKLGITTGILRNKSKVILKAMGDFATTNVYKTVSDAKEYFGIMPGEPGEEIVSTNSARSWSGIKGMAKNTDVKLASQEVFEKVIAASEEIGIDNLSEYQRIAYDKAVKHLKNMEDFRTSIDAYSDVKARRREEKWGWLLSNNTPKALDKSSQEEVIYETNARDNDLTKKLEEQTIPTEEVVYPPKATKEKEIETDFTIGNDG